MALRFSSLVSSNPTLGKGSSPHAGGLRRAPGSGRPLSLRCTALADGAATAVIPNPTAQPVEKAIPIRLPTQPPKPTPVQPGVRRSSFPPGFLFGGSTSSLQVEGAANEGGRGPSIWDTFAVEHPEKIADKSTPDVACDSYHKYKVGMGIQKSFGVIMLNMTSGSHFSVPSVKNLVGAPKDLFSSWDDVNLIKEAGMDVYRFSISWPRILPKGSLAGGLNKAGIRYYNNLINELLANGITPFVTIFHWDVPQALEDEYGGFRDKRIIEDLTDFAEMCFRLFGDRVKHWITENEPYMFATVGYDNGAGAPGRCSPSLGCAAGDSATEPYIVAHNLILAHASIVKLYREEFQDVQKGKIGLTLNINWSIPYSQSKEDIDARERALDFNTGWFLNPVVHGDYPFIMKALVGERLPKFTEEETKLVKGSYDFVGVNYYFTTYAKGTPYTPNDTGISFTKDQFADQLMEKAGVHIGETTRSQGFYSYPEGMKELLVYIKKTYKSPTIYITENGVPDDDNGLSFEDALDDKERIKYLNDHLTKVQEAIGLGVDVKGYYTWSLLDNWEWVSGYTKRFGVSYVDYQNEQKRYQKDSFKWFAKVLKT